MAKKRTCKDAAFATGLGFRDAALTPAYSEIDVRRGIARVTQIAGVARAKAIFDLASLHAWCVITNIENSA
jgi:hypothetical protein